MIVSLQRAAALAPCGLQGIGCTGQCSTCPGRSQLKGLGFSIANLPAPLNDWRVLAAIAVVVLLLVGTGLLKGGKSASRRKLRIARLKYTEEAARIQRQAA